MTITLPESTAGQTLTCSITVNGTILEDTYPLVSIQTIYEINRIPYAQGNLEAKTLSKGFGQQELTLYSGTPMDAANLKLRADSKLLRMRLSALKGTVTFQGSGKVSVGDMIELAGLGDRYNGMAYVSVVDHTIEEGSWITRVDFGLDSKPISELPQFSYSPAMGQFPAIHGLQVGIVKQLDQDPQAQFRLLVTIPGMKGTESLWARMASIYATNAAGFYFLPEVGDEVILGFWDDNPSHPVILGSLYSGKHTAAFATEAKNNTKFGFTAKGNDSAEISASGQTVVKGAMVMIN